MRCWLIRANVTIFWSFFTKKRLRIFDVPFQTSNWGQFMAIITLSVASFKMTNYAFSRQSVKQLNLAFLACCSWYRFFLLTVPNTTRLYLLMNQGHIKSQTNYFQKRHAIMKCLLEVKVGNIET